MAVILRRNLGTALTYDQLDDNFVDYTTFRDKFDQTDWVGSGDGKVLFYDNNTGKIKIKELTADDLNTGAFNTNFNTRFAGKTTADLSEGSNLYYTSARANADFDTRLATKSTTNLSEGTNKYYTDARVLTKMNATSVTALSDIPSAAATDNAKVITYDANTDSFRYSSLLTESLLPVTDHGLITDSDVVTGSTGVTTTSLQSLSNVNFASVNNAVNENVLFYNGSEWVAGVITTTGNVRDNGVTTFPAMTDTPTNYTGSAGKFVKVKSGEDGLEFVTPSTSDITEGSSKFYTDSRFDTRLSAKTTDDLTEGSSNLYYTDTKVDNRISNRLEGNVRMRLPSYTTSARDSLSGVVNGEMIYNTTVNKIQGYENGAWKDLSTVYG